MNKNKRFFGCWEKHDKICQGLVWFVVCSDTWSQLGYSVSCMPILCINLQIARSGIRPHIKWTVSLVIAYGHFSLT